VDVILQDGTVYASLKKMYQKHPWLTDYYGDNVGLINNNLNERIDQLRLLATFLINGSEVT